MQRLHPLSSDLVSALRGTKGAGGLPVAAQLLPLGPEGVSRPCRQERSRMAARSQLPKLIPFMMLK